VDGPFAGSGNGHSVSVGKNDPKRIRDHTLPMGLAHGVICPVQRNALCGLHRGDRYSEVCKVERYADHTMNHLWKSFGMQAHTDVRTCVLCQSS